jgi:predicted RNase H-like HicB family nuclease
MKIKVIVHEAEEGGYWAEVPALPGCATPFATDEEGGKRTPTESVVWS